MVRERLGTPALDQPVQTLCPFKARHCNGW